ncbi:MAG: hypothetical protein OXR64_09555 [Chloroflexota bacterium]|nr:hypothetical protein [Chloroflexota bacterium]MDE2920080.1 hypothetical protein [Chloroflexota bacterium]
MAVGAPALAGLLPACGEPPVNPRISVLLALNEILPGPHRFPFVLVDGESGAVSGARIQVRFVRLIGERDEFRFEAPAQEYIAGASYNHIHEDGKVHVHDLSRSYYLVSDAEFEEGLWRADLEVQPTDGSDYAASTAFQVGHRTTTPRIGDPAPASAHPTVHDVAALDLLSTSDPPLPALYQHSIGEALSRAEPFVVAFSTPGYCTSAMCGPVTAVVGSLAQRFGDRLRFIHLEPFDLNVARAEGRLVWADVAREWNLETEPWVFVIDTTGRVAARFEGLVGAAELEPAIAAVAGPPLR